MSFLFIKCVLQLFITCPFLFPHFKLKKKKIYSSNVQTQRHKDSTSGRVIEFRACPNKPLHSRRESTTASQLAAPIHSITKIRKRKQMDGYQTPHPIPKPGPTTQSTRIITDRPNPHFPFRAGTRISGGPHIHPRKPLEILLNITPTKR